MQITKRCHIVPRSYLKRFSQSDGSKIACYDRGNLHKPVDLMSLKKAPVIMHYYVLRKGSLIGDAVLPECEVEEAKILQHFEHQLGQIEDHCKGMFDKFELGDYSIDVLKAVAMFVGIQCRRVPKDLKDYLFWKNEASKDELDGAQILANNLEKLKMLESMKGLIPPFIASCLGGSWTVANAENSEFITSDNPVYLSMGNNEEKIKQLFSSSPDHINARELSLYTYYIPISPKKLLMLKPSEDIPPLISPNVREGRYSAEKVQYANQEMARFCYERVFARDIDLLTAISKKFDRGELISTWNTSEDSNA